MSGAEAKLTLITYKNSSFSSEGEKFEASVQPNSISIKGNLSYVVGASIGAPAAVLRYNTTNPRVMSFALIFDATGAISGVKDNVSSKCDKLKELFYDYNQEGKSPYFIRVLWGEVDFKGRLLNMDIVYSMFSSTGKPIRATANIHILETPVERSKPTSSESSANKDSSGDSNSNKAQSQSSPSGNSRDASNGSSPSENSPKQPNSPGSNSPQSTNSRPGNTSQDSQRNLSSNSSKSGGLPSSSNPNSNSIARSNSGYNSFNSSNLGNSENMLSGGGLSSGMLGGISAITALSGVALAATTMSPLMRLIKKIEHYGKEGYNDSKNYVESKKNSIR